LLPRLRRQGSRPPAPAPLRQHLARAGDGGTRPARPDPSGRRRRPGLAPRPRPGHRPCPQLAPLRPRRLPAPASLLAQHRLAEAQHLVRRRPAPRPPPPRRRGSGMTPLARAHAAMEAAPDDDRARLAFYEALAAAELLVPLDPP